MKKTFKILLPFLLIFVVGLIAYSNSFHCPFQFDDRGFIMRNPDIRSFETVWSPRWGKSSRFLGFLSFALNFHFHQLDVFGYHVVNFIIHMLNAFLVFWFVSLLLRSGQVQEEKLKKHSGLIALFAGLLFAAHPVQTEAVTYICQRFASLATLFYLLSLCAYLKARFLLEEKRKPAAAGFFLLAVASALCSMFTKEISFTLPFMMILVEIFFFDIKTSFKKHKRVFVAAAVAILLLMIVVPMQFSFNVSGILNLKSTSGSHNADGIITVKEYFLTQSRVIWTYLRLLFLPVNLNLDYDYPASKSVDTVVMICFLGIAAILAAGVKLFKKYRCLSFGIFFFFLALSVESSFILIRHMIFEHRLYLPLAGFCLFAAVGLFRLCRKPGYYIGVFILIILTFSVMTYQRNRVWMTPITLWEDIARKSPRKARPYINLCGSYLRQGQNRIALEYCHKALSFNVGSFMARNNLGLILSSMGEYDDAIAQFNKALAINGRADEALNNRGNTYAKKGNFDQAIKDFTEAIEMNPELETGYNNRGFVYILAGELDKAMEDIQTAIRMNPSIAEMYHNRAIILMKRKEYDSALKDLDRAIKKKPSYVNAYYLKADIYKTLGQQESAYRYYSAVLTLAPEHLRALMNRGNILFERKNYRKALADFNRALAVSPDYPGLLYNRANTYQLMGDWKNAVADYSREIAAGRNLFASYNNRGNVYRDIKQYELSVQDFTQALRLNPKDGMVYFNRAMSYIGMNKTEQALADLKKARSLGYPVSDQLILQLQNK